MTDLMLKLNALPVFASACPEGYQYVKPTPIESPYWVHHNPQVTQLLGLDSSFANADNLKLLSGQPSTCSPLAMVYSGHQFGGYSPQLGDGRGLLLGQIDTPKGLVDLHLKGAGKTPYSRFGDGRAVLRSSIREYLGSEAVYQLGVASTRALCLIGSETPVQRERIETAAMLTRTASTHIRFGHFEYFHYQNQPKALVELAEYVIDNHLPSASGKDDRYQQLLTMAVVNTATMIAGWQSIGFAHGVMNTDNFSILGETFDYGPYAFLDDYDPLYICNHSDTEGRYRFDRQPGIGLWNCQALAQAFSSLILQADLHRILALYETTLVKEYAKRMRAKFGFNSEHAQDQALCADWLSLLAKYQADYSVCFRALSQYHQTLKIPRELSQQISNTNELNDWLTRYRARCEQEIFPDRIERMNQTNPWYCLRNYHLQRAIELAQQKQFNELERLFFLVTHPFTEHPDLAEYHQAPPALGKRLSISCSS